MHKNKITARNEYFKNELHLKPHKPLILRYNLDKSNCNFDYAFKVQKLQLDLSRLYVKWLHKKIILHYSQIYYLSDTWHTLSQYIFKFLYLFNYCLIIFSTHQIIKFLYYLTLLLLTTMKTNFFTTMNFEKFNDIKLCHILINEKKFSIIWKLVHSSNFFI
jgi:hypothetical protein